ncbi:hypothetical protein [Paenibacillus apiarius]|uniref:hypothetical protein n=1 Tax=Paenibacillus apiarius TaxID=46240 RepID=UPI00197F34C1|nr:hypothetical protein [Paenibacillus apiarius]MBN3524867.1 hypothetical protein [Paenibacillus apiarius]
MKKRRIITSLCFAVLLTVSSASLALAQSTISQSNVLNAYGKKFTISHKADGKLTQKELQAIAKQATSEEIRIENVYHAPTEKRETFTPSAWYDVSVDWNGML